MIFIENLLFMSYLCFISIILMFDISYVIFAGHFVYLKDLNDIINTTKKPVKDR